MGDGDEEEDKKREGAMGDEEEKKKREGDGSDSDTESDPAALLSAAESDAKEQKIAVKKTKQADTQSKVYEAAATAAAAPQGKKEVGLGEKETTELALSQAAAAVAAAAAAISNQSKGEPSSSSSSSSSSNTQVPAARQTAAGETANPVENLKDALFERQAQLSRIEIPTSGQNRGVVSGDGTGVEGVTWKAAVFDDASKIHLFGAFMSVSAAALAFEISELLIKLGIPFEERLAMIEQVMNSPQVPESELLGLLGYILEHGNLNGLPPIAYPLLIGAVLDSVGVLKQDFITQSIAHEQTKQQVVVTIEQVRAVHKELKFRVNLAELELAQLQKTQAEMEKEDNVRRLKLERLNRIEKEVGFINLELHKELMENNARSILEAQQQQQQQQIQQQQIMQQAQLQFEISRHNELLELQRRASVGSVENIVAQKAAIRNGALLKRKGRDEGYTLRKKMLKMTEKLKMVDTDGLATSEFAKGLEYPERCDPEERKLFAEKVFGQWSTDETEKRHRIVV